MFFNRCEPNAERVSKIELAAIFGASEKQVKRNILYFGALSVKFARVSFEAVSRIIPQD